MRGRKGLFPLFQNHHSALQMLNDYLFLRQGHMLLKGAFSKKDNLTRDGSTVII